MLLNPNQTTLSKDLSTKTILIQENPNFKVQLKEYFLRTYAIYEKLFELLKVDRAYYIRA